jgi:hypothetical protein
LFVPLSSEIEVKGRGSEERREKRENRHRENTGKRKKKREKREKYTKKLCRSFGAAETDFFSSYENEKSFNHITSRLSGSS